MNEDDHTEEGDQTPSSTYETPRDRGWISIRHFATLQDVTYHTVLRWIFEERVLTVVVGGRHRIYEEEVEYQLKHGTRPPNKEKIGKFGKEGKGQRRRYEEERVAKEHPDVEEP